MSVYNGETYLQEAINSILHQQFTDFEFIIINDGSTDRSAGIIQSYHDARIRYFENGQNIGLIDSLNHGLSLARSPYIARMDADDVSLPERLARQVDFLNVHPEIGVVGSAVQVIDGAGNPSHVWRFPTEHGVIAWRLFFADPIAHPTVMIRREVVSQVGGYSADMVHAEDYDLWRRLSHTTCLSNLPDVLLRLRRHESCVTRAHHTQQWNNSIRISHLMISEVLGEDVPMRLVQHLWGEQFQSLNDVRQVANLIYRLYQASVIDNALSAAEKRVIRRDACRRLFDLGRQRTGDGYAWELIGLVPRIDPLVIGRVAAGRLRRIVRG